MFSDNKPLAAIVCGFERGGTTLLSQLIKQHPKLDSGFEGGFLLGEKISDFRSIEPYCTNLKRGWQINDRDLKYICEADSWFEVYGRLLERSPIIKRKNQWIFDKTPRYMQCLSHVLKKVPNVPCVLIVRDPRAVLWSQSKRQTKRNNLSLKEWLNRRLEKSCAAYISYANGFKKAICDGFESRILLVKYENLCINEELELRRIFDFLHLDFKPSYLSFKKGIKFSNVYGGDVSNQYLNEYKENFPKEVCEKILELTNEVSDWFCKEEEIVQANYQSVPALNQLTGIYKRQKKFDQAFNKQTNCWEKPLKLDLLESHDKIILEVERSSRNKTDLLSGFAVDSPKAEIQYDADSIDRLRL